jgi:CRISPR-associated protein Cmr3
MNWYAFTPVDTLFFKGAAQMDKGLDHTAASHFPPLPETIAGALRTQILREHGINFADFKAGKIAADALPLGLGKYGETAPFEVTGPLLQWKDRLFVPAPYTWFGETKTLKKANTFAEVTPIAIRKAAVIRSELVKSRGTELTWNGADPDQDALGGLLVAVDDLNAREAKCYPERLFISREVRTGIALETDKRHVKEGHLYSFTHFRLHEGVRIVFAVNMALPLPASGLLSLGGEKRFGRLDQMPAVDLPQGQENLYLAVSPVLASDENHAALIAGGKIFYRGGWDLAKKFHKPMRGYYPAGSVFKENINNNCIAL